MATNKKQLSYGSSGDEVKELQTTLNNNGYSLDVDGKYGPQTQAAVKDYQTKNSLKVDGITGNETWGSLLGNTQKASAPSIPTMPTAQQAAPTGFASAYDAQIDELMAQINGREPFSYDINKDALYQQYADQYAKSGKMAMQDAMGQAATMTGGYGSSYAQTAGQQAYNAHLEELNNIMPQLYQMAYDRHNQEGQDLWQRYAMLTERENQEYARYQDAIANEQWQQSFDRDVLESDRAYDYQVGRDTIDDKRYEEELEYQKYLDEIAQKQWQDSFDHGQEQDWISNGQWQAEFEHMQEQDKIAGDQWQKTFDAEYGKPDESGTIPGSTGMGSEDPFDFTGWDSNDFMQYFNGIAESEGPERAVAVIRQLGSLNKIGKGDINYYIRLILNAYNN